MGVKLGDVEAKSQVEGKVLDSCRRSTVPGAVLSNVRRSSTDSGVRRTSSPVIIRRMREMADLPVLFGSGWSVSLVVLLYMT